MQARLYSVLCAFTLVAGLPAHAQSGVLVWPEGKKAAIALTYDDSLDSQLDIALPQLDRHGFKATFYLTIERSAFESRVDEWRAVAADGHELGNHTLFHACRASLPDRDWVTPEADLDTYSVTRMVKEVAIANTVLKLVDGEDERTFAYPCGESSAGGTSYIDALKSLVTGARGAGEGVLAAGFDPYAITTYGVPDASAEAMIAYVDDAVERGALGTFTFHGIGGDYLSVSAEAHAGLLDYLNERRADIWVAPLDDILRYVKEKRSARE